MSIESDMGPEKRAECRDAFLWAYEMLGNPDYRGKVECLMWYLRQEFNDELDDPKLSIPNDLAHKRDTYVRGVLEGIGTACENLVDPEKIQEAVSRLEGNDETEPKEE